jgi:hypothetical protein
MKFPWESDISEQKPHSQVVERRAKVAELIRVKTENDIAVILGVSRATVARDVAFLKKLARDSLDELSKGGFIFEYMTTLERIKSYREKYDELYNQSDGIRERTAILKESRENDKRYLELLGETPTIHAFRKAVEKTNVQTT